MSDRAAYATIGFLTLVVVGLVGVLMTTGGGARPGALDVTGLPRLNATLNAISAGLLVAGWVCIRRRRVTAHIACMLGAFAVSTLFLLSYVTYHYYAGSRPFTGQGWIRPVYFLLLLSHIVLAAVIVPFVLTTLHRAIRADFTRHRRLARLTLPLWLYVSITGVLVYLLLYRLYPG
jgi:putative membrane protein